jgi:plastocyanin
LGIWKHTFVAAMFLAATFVAFATGPAAAESVTVAVGDIYFCDPSFEGERCVTTVTEGDTVVWDFSAAELPHTATGDAWDSGIIDDGGSYSFTFAAAGSYDYLCQVHPTLQLGRIVVEAAPIAAPTDDVSDDGPAAPTPEPGAATPGQPVSAVPATGQGAGGGAFSWWIPAILAAAGAGGLVLAAAVRRQEGS